MIAPRRLASLLLQAALAPLAFALTPTAALAAPFNDVGGPSGTGDTTNDVGAAWGDYDNDGDLDLYLSKDGSPNALWRNNGNGTFTGVGVASGTNNNGAGRGVAWGDYDSDGFLDLYLANDGPNRLYHNNGNGTFTDVGAASGTADGGSGRGVAWGDYDSDGFLDLYLANDGPNRLYHNNGNGTFTEVGAATGTADTGNGVGVAWGDYDNDRDLDLYLANDNGTNRLYRNNGNGTFTETAAAAGCSDTGRSSGVAWGDYDNDGDLDLYVGKYGTANRLFRNNGNGTFTSVGPASNTDDTGNATGVAWGDYDHDGDLDLYVANVASTNRHYRNNGNGTFTDVASSMGTNDPGNGQGVAWADYDNDGDLDLYLANVLGTDRLFRNDTAVVAGSHWLHVNLVGSVSNRSGVGARVRCVTGTIGRICEISGGSGYLSQGSLTAEFGLGGAASVDTVVVLWPSGLVQAVPNPGVDQRVTITEAALFTEVGAASGTDDGGNGYAGVAWGDYDADGDPDLYVVNQFNAPNKLYRNNGNGTFTDVGAASGTNNAGTGRAAAWADYDDDGDLDLYLSNDGASRLYRSNGDGTFTDVAATAGVENNTTARGVAWGDYNRDGYLDLYVANHGGPNRLYRNNLDGTFTDVAAASGTGDPQNSDNAAWGDYNRDGDLDLYVATFGGTNRLYRNNDNGTFTEVGAASGTADMGQSTGADWGDYDGDGDLDLYVAKYATPNRLYRNNGNDTFAEVGVASGTADGGGSLGVAWGDYDNDRDLDLFVTNDGGPNRLYRNNGNGTFAEIGNVAGTGENTISRGAAWADYDLDGDLDLYLAKDGPNRLYRNDHAVPPGRHWLQVELVGRQSNRSGIGGRVRCVAGGVASIRLISGGSGYLSQNSLTAEFGLGTATTVDSLVVYWPSGIVQAVAPPSVDQRITVTERESEYFATLLTAVASFNTNGASWGDYDNDGDHDLYVSSNGWHLLYRNNANGTFTDVASAAGIYSSGDFGAAWADYDNDGDLDLYVPTYFPGPSVLYRNNGDGTFTDVAGAAGVWSYADSGVWGDFDNDGYVDLYTTSTLSNQLFKNNGNGTFTDVGASSGTSAPSNTLGLAWGDYDNDNDLDLCIGDIQGTGRLYRNNGNATFSDVAVQSGINASATRGVSWGDYDNDGDLDLYLARWPSSNVLYRNNGNGTFTDWTSAAGILGGVFGTGGIWGDYNNDGHLDLYSTKDGFDRNQLYRSAGNGTFTDVAAATGTDFRGSIQSASWADYDNDGDLDLHVPDAGGQARLCRNDSPARHWLHVNLVGTVSNRSGIGARVRCVSGGRSMSTQISGGQGRSQSSLTAAFGLGAGTVVDTLEVRWPSGIVQRMLNPGADQRITVTETESAPFQFTDAAAASGTNDSGPSLGMAWGDYDSDGDLDLYLAQSDPTPQNRLYRNNGNDTFTDVAVASGTVGNGNSHAAVWGDYDNDGDLDLYLTAHGGTNQLFRNNGNQTFTDVGAASGTNDTGSARSAAWGDYDQDGLLDLYVTKTGANRLYHNQGNGTFSEVGAGTGTNDAGDGTGVAWGDYDSDGDLDLFVANHLTPNRLYRNNGNGTFSEVSAAAGTDYTGPSHGVAWGDYDNDGDLDLYLANLGTPNRLYRNNGNGTFAEVGAASGTNDPGLSRGAAWGDFDDDGYLDLYVTNDGVSRLYKNNGNGTFSESAGVYGTAGTGLAVGVAWADYDGDGDLDLYVAVLDGPNHLYRNDNIPLVGNHWLEVDLVGTQSNREGIGARVRCVAGGRSLIREVSGGSGYLSQEPLIARFGLGLATTVDTLEVRWPSGIVQVVTNPGADEQITVTEQETSGAPDTAAIPGEYALYANVPNPFNPATLIRFDLPSAGGVHLTVFDVAGRPVRRLLAGSERPAGRHQVTWDGRSEQGVPMASGIYFYQIVAKDFRATKRMTLLK